MSTDQNNAAKALIDTHVPNEILNVGYQMSPSDSQRLKMQGRNNEALESLYGAITYPYLGTLISARTNLSVSDYKNEADNYANKLAPFVAKNVGKDEQWVLKYTDPSVVRVYDIDDNGRNNGLPAYTMTKELLKIDYDAYNRNHGIKSDENTSDNKNQSTTNTKKDQSSEKVTNDTTSKKDQSTTNTSSSNTNQTTENKSSTTSLKTTSDTKTPVAKNEGSAAKTTDVVKNENKATENTASVVKNDAKAATENTADVKVVAPAKNASNEVKTTDAAAKASDAHVVALNSKVNAGTTSTTPAAAAKDSQAKATENKLPQAGTDEKISLFASLAGLSIVSLGLGALGASKKRKND
ncbi:MAG: LPXTG cell wall anchor domain-containing protein [Lactobacillus johnsonii]|nr:LPXTG cell wall anchor domain-containing protein [Lactobacillus johnsonii]MCI6229546.1 LPXTG cell wall anchor domain-containing protein [Lactobacillus johnsonii]MCI6761564.1 LPXTG cell wall anchor domain-containing protein [Lactobacillus johnsonii]MCI7714946.1 LPXTG cell wall anchor domain-containing protein [Lactobacillus johnsonii]MDY2874106.1 LPXTG cell wall anchor domain-containing protein [Lactobacillus johnsonii]